MQRVFPAFPRFGQFLSSFSLPTLQAPVEGEPGAEQQHGESVQPAASRQAVQAADSAQQEAAGQDVQAAESAQQQPGLSQLRAKLHRGEQPSAAELMPHTTAWNNRVKGCVRDLQRAVAQLSAVPPPAGAAQRDADMLAELLAGELTEEQRSAAEASLEATRKFGRDGVAPQAVLLVTNHKLEWDATCTSLLASDAAFRPYFELLQRAFQQSLGSAALRQHKDSLPDLREVQVQPGMPEEAAPPPPRKVAPAKVLRQKMTALWRWLQPLMDSLGENSCGRVQPGIGC